MEEVINNTQRWTNSRQGLMEAKSPRFPSVIGKSLTTGTALEKTNLTIETGTKERKEEEFEQL